MASYMPSGMNQGSQTRQPMFSARGRNILLLAAPQPGSATANLGTFKSAKAHLTPAAQAALEEAWEAQAFAEDLQASNGVNHQWPPRSYTCTFCAREFRTAQALGGHMNVHRRERAQANQLALFRQASSSLTYLATSGAPVQTQLQAAAGPFACVITHLQQEGNHIHGQALPHVDASHHPELSEERRNAATVAAIGRPTTKLAAPASAGRERKTSTAQAKLQQVPHGGGATGPGYQDLPSTPAPSSSDSPLSSPRPSTCSSSSNADGNSRMTRKGSLYSAALNPSAAPDCGTIAARSSIAPASFMQILPPGGGTGAPPALELLPIRACQPFDCTEPSKNAVQVAMAAHHSAAAGCVVKRKRLDSGESNHHALRKLGIYYGDAECKDCGLDLELRL